MGGGDITVKQMIPDLITLEGAIDLHCHPYPDLFPACWTTGG